MNFAVPTNHRKKRNKRKWMNRKIFGSWRTIEKAVKHELDGDHKIKKNFDEKQLHGYFRRQRKSQWHGLTGETYKEGLHRGGTRGVMVIVAGNGHGDTSSNSRQDWLHFT